jgi:hypothetical protein
MALTLLPAFLSTNKLNGKQRSIFSNLLATTFANHNKNKGIQVVVCAFMVHVEYFVLGGLLHGALRW